ncbi:MAG TPA: hypothetical protein VI248_20860, partial [Kineosporiaceae bacterium]
MTPTLQAPPDRHEAVRPAGMRRAGPVLLSVLGSVWALCAVVCSIGVIIPSTPLLGLAGLYVNGYAVQVLLLGAAGF